ncbi:pentapeptide repeat-containing protein [Pseudomonas sp. H3_G03]
MSRFVTPSLSAFKSDAAVLLRDFRDGCPDATKRLARYSSRPKTEINLATCLRAIAREYETTYEEITAEEQLISRYAQHSYAQGYWRQPYSGEFRRARFLLQFDALIECLRDQVPLAVAAKKRNVDFSGFHFSSLLFSRISLVLDRKKLPDFSNLQAPESLVHSHWILDVKSFRKSDFRDAKFYSISVDPLVLPGVNCWMADFDNADLTGADFRGSYLRGASFCSANLEGVDFRNANIFECNFTRAQGAFVSGNVPDDDWDVGPCGAVIADDDLKS